MAQCPEGDLEAFQDIERHQYFNTNNIWIKLDKLKEVLEVNGGVLDLPVIRNTKTVDPRDADTTPVYQLEQAMGSAVECFEGAIAVNVPRSRFAPVKGTTDLFALRSDAYVVENDGRVQLAPERKGRPPVVKFSGDYKLVDALEGLGQPSLIEAEELSVSGPVVFAEGVIIKGSVSITNHSNEPLVVAAGIYENDEITREA